MTKIKNRLSATLFSRLLRNENDIEYASGYAETGYHSPESGILFANWNVPRLARIAKIAEKLGYECEWCDEWTTCQDCGKAVRTQPDCHSWLPHYDILNECELVCAECIKASPVDYLESLVNDPQKAVTFLTDVELAENGFMQLENYYENGFHPGQNDKPDEILKKLLEANPKGEFIFRI